MQDLSRRPVYVLALDDDKSHLEVIRLTLEPEGYRVTVAENCVMARRALMEGSYDILLADLKLQDGDGIDFMTWAREKDPNLVAIVLTGHSSTDTALAAMHHGAYDYLTKPYPPKLLVACISRAAEKHRLSRALTERSVELETLNKELQHRIEGATREIYLLNERLKRFVGELLETNEGRVRFMETLSHELKNPMSVVRGYASFLLDRPLDQWTKEELIKVAQAVYRNTDSMQALIDELMEATQVSAHKIALRLEPLSSCEEVMHAVEGLAFQAQAKGITLSADCAGNAPVLEADRTRLRQILSNLIANAIKFTPKDGRITVSVRAIDDHAQFTVKDTGLGMPDKQLARIFDRYYQSETAAKHKGLGLGLEIAKGLVTLHGGRIWAESKVGEGSQFHFILPLHAPKEMLKPTTLAPKVKSAAIGQ